jgi:predicted small lipoprotein YifL
MLWEWSNNLKYIGYAKLLLKLSLIIPLLSACGQKGALYLPDETDVTNPQPVTQQSRPSITTTNAN